jgi:hypothetical protein
MSVFERPWDILDRIILQNIMNIQYSIAIIEWYNGKFDILYCKAGRESLPSQYGALSQRQVRAFKNFSVPAERGHKAGAAARTSRSLRAILPAGLTTGPLTATPRLFSAALRKLRP